MFFKVHVLILYLSLFARDTNLMNVIPSIACLSVYHCTNVDVCLLIFILKTDVPRFSCDISIQAKDNCFCCENTLYHYYSSFRVISVIFYYMRICPRRIYVHLLVHVCLVNIQNLVQPLSFQCLYQKHNHLISHTSPTVLLSRC